MKRFLAALLTLITISAFAAPGVGSYSLYNVSGTINGTYKMEITAIDPASNQYTYTYTTTLGGQSSSEEEVVSAEEVNSRETNATIVQLCETAVGGTSEVLTVAAGTFMTCKLTSQDGGQTYYLADVPFGFIKLIHSNGTTMELKSYEYK